MRKNLAGERAGGGSEPPPYDAYTVSAILQGRFVNRPYGCVEILCKSNNSVPFYLKMHTIRRTYTGSFR